MPLRMKGTKCQWCHCGMIHTTTLIYQEGLYAPQYGRDLGSMVVLWDDVRNDPRTIGGSLWLWYLDRGSGQRSSCTQITPKGEIERVQRGDIFITFCCFIKGTVINFRRQIKLQFSKQIVEVLTDCDAKGKNNSYNFCVRQENQKTTQGSRLLFLEQSLGELEKRKTTQGSQLLFLEQFLRRLKE